MSSQADSSPRRQASALSALARVVVAAVILGGIYFAYAQYQENTREVNRLSKKAHDLIQKDNPRDYLEAAGLLEDALAIRGNDRYAVAAKAEVETLLWVEHGLVDREATARAMIERAASRAPNLAERYSAEALARLARGELDAAERELMKLAEEGTPTARIISLLAVVHARQGKGELARNDLKQAAERDWRSPRYTAMYAESYLDAGDFVNAQNTFQKALEMSRSTHLRSLVGKARVDVARHERVTEALETIDDVLARGDDELSPPLRSRALVARAEALLAQGEADKAEESLQKALAIETAKSDPAYAYAHFNLGLVRLQKEDAAAIEAFKAAIAHYPYVVRFYFQSALALAEAGRKDDGEALLALYEQNDKLPKNDLFHLARGDFRRTLGDLDGAFEAYEAARTENEVNPEVYFKKGLVLQTRGLATSGAARTGLFNEAREEYEKAVRIREKYPEVYRQMGLIYLDTNPRSGEALNAFGKALEFYKAAKAQPATVKEFIEEVKQRYLRAGLRGNAQAWEQEATRMVQ